MTVEKKQEIALHTGLTAIGGLAYGVIELLWRGHTHWSMLALGGLCFEMIGHIHRRWQDRPLVLRCGLCTFGVTAMEFISGCVLNLWLRLAVWDYSHMRFQLLGQICLLYSLFWFLLSALAWPLYHRLYCLLRRIIA